ncbi:hypothetical protein GC197_17865 [bacterium]|nr:hypothetical protein [bacterium]
MMRRKLLKWIAGGLAYGVVAGLVETWQTSPAFANRVSLKDTLNNELYIRTPDQTAFINKVVNLVNNGSLSLRLVYSTLEWSLRFEKGKRYYYFAPALKKRAKAEGVSL